VNRPIRDRGIDMEFQWILSPVLQCGLEVVGLGLCLYLFFTLKREGRVTEVRCDNQRKAVETSLCELQAAIQELRERLRETEERTGMLVAPGPLPSGMNLTKRTQALRMHRRGEPPQKIAAVLSLPQREVELLVKVQRIALEQSV
jgi:hypothetical protein